jgi:hypothetical protein
MSRIEEVQAIRKQTLLELPKDDTYIFRLGVALYGFASINSFMTEIICHIDPQQDRTALLDATSGSVLNAFRHTLKMMKQKGLFPQIHVNMQTAADLFEALNTERTDFVHAYPITNTIDKQILHRRKDDKGKYFEVDNDFLDGFISRLHNVSTELYAIRKIVRPDL